jgi:hypothetical protein
MLALSDDRLVGPQGASQHGDRSLLGARSHEIPISDVNGSW